MKAYLVVLFFVFLLRGFVKILSIIGTSEVKEEKDLSSNLSLIIFLTVLGVIADALIVISLIAAFVSQF